VVGGRGAKHASWLNFPKSHNQNSEATTNVVFPSQDLKKYTSIKKDHRRENEFHRDSVNG